MGEEVVKKSLYDINYKNVYIFAIVSKRFEKDSKKWPRGITLATHCPILMVGM